MEDLRKALESHGFLLPELKLNGEIIRFGRNGGRDNAWFIGFQNHSVNTGKVYSYAIYGDWRTREEYEYKPSGLSRADSEAIKTQTLAAKKKRESEKLDRQIKASEKAQSVWASATDQAPLSEYLTRKKIDNFYGAKILSDQRLIVPLCDFSGKLWAVQYIWPDGQKRFNTGAKVDGNFFVIGPEPTTEALLCEGFATGCSIFMATGKTVIVCIDAGNLVKVAKLFHEKHPDLSITICGDDDRSKTPNTGREKGEKAAMLAHAVLVFPEFAGETGSDFNDLHCQEGLAVVKSQLIKEADPEVGFSPLGYDESIYFFYHVKSKDIVKISGFAKHQLFELAPKEYWEQRFQNEKGPDWNAAVNHLVQMSRAVGPFDSTRVRGTGVWIDDGRIVVNTGHSLIVNKKEIGLSKIRSWYIYVQTRNRIPPLSQPLETGKDLIDACLNLAWIDPKSGYLLAGWLAIARIAGALEVRPHVWLTGGSGTGKSTVMNGLIAPALGGPKGKLFLHGASTEAGVRQIVKSSSLPLIFDEFETTGEPSKARIQSLIELLRVCWSGSQGKIIKGSGSGAAVEFEMAIPALVSSVRVNLDNDADRSRFSILELAPHNDNAGRWKAVQTALANIDEDYGERLFARSCGLVKEIVASQKIFQKLLAAQVNQRFGQQVGTLLAGFWSLEHQEAITEREAAAILSELDFKEECDDSKLADEQECLRHLMTWKLSFKKPDGHVIETTLERIITSSVYQTAIELEGLKNYGMMYKDKCLWVYNNHAELQKIFKSTRWTQWYRSLLRLKNAQRSTVYMAETKINIHATKISFV